jgi:hypothetical protein
VEPSAESADKLHFTEDSSFHSSWVSCVQLSLWDNIFGPQVLRLWTGNEAVPEETQHSIARQVLSGEIGRGDKGPKPETTLHVLPELEYAISSTMFSGPFRGSMSKLAFSLVYRQHHLSRYLDYHVVVVDRMNYLVTKFKEALKKTPDRALNIFTDQAFYFAASLEPLWRASLPAPPLFENSFVYSGGFSGEFLAKAVTGLLQTGASVVLGPNQDLVNAFIDTMALFLSPAERRRCRHAYLGCAYTPDLLLQGLVGVPRPSEEIMLQSLRPTSLIDLGNLSVRRMYAFNEYSIVQREYRSWEIDKLLQKAPTNAIFELGQKSQLTPVTTAPMIVTLFRQLLSIHPTCRETFLLHCLQRLRRRALALIKYVEAELAKSRKKTPHAPPRFLEAASKAQMRFDLDLQHEDDYLLLLHLADTMQPGIYTQVENPDIFLHNVLEFFDNFAS